MNKKGEFTLLQTITVLAGILSAIIIFTIVSKTISSHAINMNFIAKDSALLADTLQATPQSARVIYTSEFLDEAKLDLYGRSFISFEYNYLCVGVDPTQEIAQSCFVRSYFIPSNHFASLKSSVGQATFFLIKEGLAIFVSSTPDAIATLEVTDAKI